MRTSSCWDDKALDAALAMDAPSTWTNVPQQKMQPSVNATEPSKTQPGERDQVTVCLPAGRSDPISMARACLHADVGAPGLVEVRRQRLRLQRHRHLAVQHRHLLRYPAVAGHVHQRELGIMRPSHAAALRNLQGGQPNVSMRTENCTLGVVTRTLEGSRAGMLEAFSKGAWHSCCQRNSPGQQRRALLVHDRLLIDALLCLMHSNAASLSCVRSGLYAR